MLWVDLQGLCLISLGEAIFLGYYSSFCRAKGLSLHQALWGPPLALSPGLSGIPQPPGAARWS